MKLQYDIVVVGAGHAGCEAAMAAGNMNKKVLLITMDMGRMGQMSCNPAMGGVAKGQIVREIDALGGYSGIISDESMIQFRMLNRSKGPAMWSPRTQNDRALFNERWRYYLEQNKNVDFWQDMVVEILEENGKATGVLTQMGVSIAAKAVIVTAGTFLNGIIHVGERQLGGGRAGERAAKGLTEQFTALGMRAGRMKTGTPPRIDGRSIDYQKMEIQEGDPTIAGFSFLPIPKPKKQKACHITYTNTEVHDILRTGFDRSPMFNGRIQGLGPRYCPSIEDKIDRFSDKNQHQLFVEPEGWNTVEVYLNGFSSSLPEEIQYQALRKIPGFEYAKMFRPGYAIEYDFFPPDQLSHSLETKSMNNLFFAGQINGTTGYEEAACQGLMAGINASLKINEQNPFVLRRDQAYIGVLIDDLITKSTDEPYRMFTSRAEYRILLRQDNADERLSQLGKTLGLLSHERWEKCQEKQDNVNHLVKLLSETSLEPLDINPILALKESSPIPHKIKSDIVLSRPNIAISDILPTLNEIQNWINIIPNSEEVCEQAEIRIKYRGYLEREKENAEKLKRLEYLAIPPELDYSKIHSLSHEAKSKLIKIKPHNVGQASRISGISPADISVLLIYLGR